MGLPALCSPAAAMVYDKDLVWRSCVLMEEIPEQGNMCREAGGQRALPLVVSSGDRNLLCT